MTDPIRNRIKAHRRVRAGDLVPHEWNFRLHPDAQRSALQALYREVGFARSLLAYELPDGRLKLIDGHLRRDLDSDMEVDVEVLDVTDEEARTLLLSIDPLAELARTQDQLHERLRHLTPVTDPGLAELWEETARRGREAAGRGRVPIPGDPRPLHDPGHLSRRAAPARAAGTLPRGGPGVQVPHVVARGPVQNGAGWRLMSAAATMRGVGTGATPHDFVPVLESTEEGPAARTGGRGEGTRRGHPRPR